MNKFLIVDASHLFHRARHVVRGSDSDKIGMALHIIFSSLSKAWRTQGANHIVFAFDGRSWRKDIYPPYKANRSENRAKQSAADQAANKLFFEAFDIFREFIKTKTNCTVLEDPILEADDLVSGFIKAHPKDEHIIVSSDGDFEQLLSKNVILYNGVADQTVTLAGVFDYLNRPVKDKKTGLPKVPPDPEWSVFEKSVRGCTSDNIFSACPGIRTKGSKKKLGLIDAFEDRHKQGFNWSAVMMQRWTDLKNVEHRVLDDYYRNVELVNLNAQPPHIQDLINHTIDASCNPRNNSQIGLQLLKFFGHYELQKLSDRVTDFSVMFSAGYPNK